MRRKEKEVREDFLRAGAMMPIDAKSLADIGLQESNAVKRLIRRAVVREASPGLFYFDEEVFQSARAVRRRMAMVLLVTLGLILLFVVYGVGGSR